MPLLNKRRPRRRPPAPSPTPSLVQRALTAAAVAVATPAGTAAADTTYVQLPVRFKSNVVALERVECPACDSVVPYQRINSRVRPHPTQSGEQRVMVIDCPHCGTVHDATLVLIGGVYSPESCVKRSA